MKTIYVILLMLLTISNSIAGQPTWHSGTIKHIYPLGSGDFVLIFANKSPSCTNPGRYHYGRVGKNSVTKEGVKILYSTALAAATMGKKVKINFDASARNCYINRLLVSF